MRKTTSPHTKNQTESSSRGRVGGSPLLHVLFVFKNEVKTYYYFLAHFVIAFKKQNPTEGTILMGVRVPSRAHVFVIGAVLFFD